MFFKYQNQTWFAGFYSNNYEDRDEEFFKWDAHVEYAQWLKALNVKPPVIVAHQPQVSGSFHAMLLAAVEGGLLSGADYSEVLYDVYAETMFAKTEMVIPLDGFMLVIAKVIPGKEHVVETVLESPEKWGMSHGFIIKKKDDKVFEEYRTFEFTIAPLSMVANQLTPVGFRSDDPMAAFDIKALSSEEQALLARAFGVSADTLLDKIKEVNDILRSQGLASKTKDTVMDENVVLDAPEVVSPVEEAAPVVESLTYETMRDKLVLELDMQGLETALKGIGETLAGLAATIQSQQQQIATLQRVEDDKITAKFMTPRWDVKSVVTAEPVEDDAERIAFLKEQSAEKQAARVEEDNPLSFAWKSFLGVGNG